MPVKRSRAGSSSAFLETSSAATAASVCQVKVMKTDNDASAVEPSKPKLTVASPVNVAEFDRMKIVGFLERCHHCKKRIAQNSEIFMYRDLCAFCSAECRDLQINLDQSAEKKPDNPKKESVEK